MLRRGRDEPGEQRMRASRTRLELRMELAAQIPGMRLQLDDLDQRAIRRQAGKREAMLDEAIAERVRYLVAMPVPLAYLLRAVHGCGTRSIAEPARILAQPHRPTHVGYVLLRLHERDYRVSAIRRELAGVAVIESHDVPCELDNRHLHA